MAYYTQDSLTSRHVNTVDPKTNQPDSKGGYHKMDMRVTRPSIPEETGREKQTSRDGEVQPRFWHWLAGLFLVLAAGIEVETVLEGVDDGSDDCAH